MIFNYKAITQSGEKKEGTIDALSKDIAISSLQRRGLIISGIKSKNAGISIPFIGKLSLFDKVSNKDIVILSRQMSTLFEAQVSALRVFKLLSSEVENETLKGHLVEIVDDLQGGSSISKALAKHPKIFSNFYVNMIKAGEESGKLDQTFSYLADYLDRTYEVTSKAKNALIYPAFVIATFFAVMILMFTVIIPKIALILIDSEQEIPVYTKIVFGASDFLTQYGLFLFGGLVVSFFFFWKYIHTPAGKTWFTSFRLSIPYLGDLYRKLYLSRIADNMNTMVLSGIPMLKAIEVTATVVDNDLYRDILLESAELVKAGNSFSSALSQSEEIPGILTQMIRVGEETGELGNILKTMAKFYQREVINAVDTLVDLIEPIMIVVLGLGVGVLLASVLMPIYNIASSAA